MPSPGIHHITAIAGEPRRNVAFYRDVLGLRLVKKTVNFDDPGTYHLYYGDETGSPGTILTFFPWSDARPGRQGTGQAVEIAFAIPMGSVAYWTQRLVETSVDHDTPKKRFGETVLAFRDPDGMALELVAVAGAEALPGFASGPVPAEHAIRGFAGQSLWLGDIGPTARVLTDVFGFREIGVEDARARYASESGSLGQRVDLVIATSPSRGFMGTGTVHHVAFRAADDKAQAAMARQLGGMGLAVTEQVDRNYFRSVYFREPGGVLFEIATDAPGFGVDEAAEHLGDRLMLPAWLEPRRQEIEAALPSLD